MALERIPADIRRDGGVARMSDPSMILEIKNAVTIPVMAKPVKVKKPLKARKPSKVVTLHLANETIPGARNATADVHLSPRPSGMMA